MQINWYLLMSQLVIETQSDGPWHGPQLAHMLTVVTFLSMAHGKLDLLGDKFSTFVLTE